MSDDGEAPRVPEGVLLGIRDLEEGRTMSDDDFDSVLDWDDADGPVRSHSPFGEKQLAQATTVLILGMYALAVLASTTTLPLVLAPVIGGICGVMAAALVVASRWRVIPGTPPEVVRRD